MGSDSKNLLFDLFDVNLTSNKESGYSLFSLRRANNEVLCVYTKRWKKFKTNYFFSTHISSLAHVEFFVVSTHASRKGVCVGRIR